MNQEERHQVGGQIELKSYEAGENEVMACSCSGLRAQRPYLFWIWGLEFLQNEVSEASEFPALMTQGFELDDPICSVLGPPPCGSQYPSIGYRPKAWITIHNMETLDNKYLDTLDP